MATSWPSWTSDNADSGDGAYTAAQKLYDQQQVVKRLRRSTWYFGDITGATETSATTKASLSYRVPDYATDSDSIAVLVRARYTAGTQVNFRLNVGAVNGTTDTKATSGFGGLTSEIAIDAAWPGTTITLNAQFWTDAGGAYDVETTELMFNLWITD